MDNKLLVISNKSFKLNDELLGIYPYDNGFIFSHLVEEDNEVVSFQNTSNPYDFRIDWGDGQVENIKGSGSLNITHEYQNSGTYDIHIRGNLRYFTTNYNNIKITDVKNWGHHESFLGFRQLVFLNQVLLEDISAEDSPKFIDSISSLRDCFRGCSNFNGNINHWDVSMIKIFDSCFRDCSEFNQPLNNWDVSNALNFIDLFRNCSKFNQNINGWDVSNVQTMDFMFYNCSVFNQPLNNWNVEKVQSTRWMFVQAHQFNQNLNSWNPISLTDSHRMFSGMDNFNQPLNDWNTSSFRDVSRMFSNCKNFNQPLDNWNNWNTAGFTNMDYMFNGASDFNQDLSMWCVSQFGEKPDGFDNSTSSWTEPKPVWGTCPNIEPSVIEGVVLPQYFQRDTNQTIGVDIYNGQITQDYYVKIQGSGVDKTSGVQEIQHGTTKRFNITGVKITNSGMTSVFVYLYDINDVLIDSEEVQIDVKPIINKIEVQWNTLTPSPGSTLGFSWWHTNDFYITIKNVSDHPITDVYIHQTIFMGNFPQVISSNTISSIQQNGTGTLTQRLKISVPCVNHMFDNPRSIQLLGFQIIWTEKDFFEWNDVPIELWPIYYYGDAAIC